MDKVFEKLPFLGSVRFYKIVVAALAIWFGGLGWIPQELVAFLVTVTGASVIVRTTDRAFENFNKKK